jgi:putative transcriptional regulator
LHLDRCEGCRLDLDRTRRALEELALGLARLAPAPSVRDHLVSRVRGAERFAPFSDRLARLFDVSGDDADAILGRIDDPSSWAPDELVSGSEILLVTPGPGRDGAIASLIRLQPDARYPRHRHLAEEYLLMLQGGVELHDGSRADAGALVESRTGSSHSFTVLPGPPCIAAALLLGPIEFETDPG